MGSPIEYRAHPETEDQISVIGIGTSPIFDITEAEAAVLPCSYERGAHDLDFAAAGGEFSGMEGRSLSLPCSPGGPDEKQGGIFWSINVIPIRLRAPAHAGGESTKERSGFTSTKEMWE